MVSNSGADLQCKQLLKNPGVLHVGRRMEVGKGGDSGESERDCIFNQPLGEVSREGYWTQEWDKTTKHLDKRRKPCVSTVAHKARAVKSLFSDTFCLFNTFCAVFPFSSEFGWQGGKKKKVFRANHSLRNFPSCRLLPKGTPDLDLNPFLSKQ